MVSNLPAWLVALPTTPPKPPELDDPLALLPPAELVMLPALELPVIVPVEEPVIVPVDDVELLEPCLPVSMCLTVVKTCELTPIPIAEAPAEVKLPTRPDVA